MRHLIFSIVLIISTSGAFTEKPDTYNSAERFDRLHIGITVNEYLERACGPPGWLPQVIVDGEKDPRSLPEYMIWEHLMYALIAFEQKAWPILNPARLGIEERTMTELVHVAKAYAHKNEELFEVPQGKFAERPGQPPVVLDRGSPAEALKCDQAAGEFLRKVETLMWNLRAPYWLGSMSRKG